MRAQWSRSCYFLSHLLNEYVFCADWYSHAKSLRFACLSKALRPYSNWGETFARLGAILQDVGSDVECIVPVSRSRAGQQRNSIDRLPSKLHSGIYQPQDLQIFTYHDIPAFKHLFLIRSWIETVIFPCCFSIFWRSWLWHYFKLTKNWWAPNHNIKICSSFRGTSELFHKGIKEHIHSLSTLICR